MRPAGRPAGRSVWRAGGRAVRAGKGRAVAILRKWRKGRMR